jgi:hypothetical protein
MRGWKPQPGPKYAKLFYITGESRALTRGRTESQTVNILNHSQNNLNVFKT